VTGGGLGMTVGIGMPHQKDVQDKQNVRTYDVINVMVPGTLPGSAHPLIMKKTMASNVTTVGDGGTKNICAPPPGNTLPPQAGRGGKKPKTSSHPGPAGKMCFISITSNITCCRYETHFHP